MSLEVADIYAALCFIGCLFAIYFGVVSGSQIFRAGDWLHNAEAQGSTGRLVAMVFMLALWMTTGIAILRRKKSAIRLCYAGAVVAGIGILVRGFVPLDIILAIPTFAIIPYLRKRAALLK